MIIDRELKFSLTPQVVTATAASTDQIDQGADGDALGKELYLVVRSVAAVTAAGAATVNIKLECDDNSGFSSPKLMLESGPIAKTAMTANKEIFRVKMPPGAERYLRINYEVATGPLTAGSFDSFLMML